MRIRGWGHLRTRWLDILKNGTSHLFFALKKKTKLEDLDKPEMFPLLPRISNLTFQSDLKINIHYSMLTVLFF